MIEIAWLVLPGLVAAAGTLAITPLVARTRNDVGWSSHAIDPGVVVSTRPRNDLMCMALRGLMCRSTLRISIHRTES